jgi:superfamily II DNA or RNA helicase
LSKRDPKKYVGVYFDECHNILPTHEGFLRAFTGRMIGLTGTPPTYTKGSKYLLIDRYFPIRFTYKIQDAIDSKIVNSCKIIVHMLPLSDKKFLQKTKKRSFFTTENKSYSFWTSKILNATPGDGIAYNIMRMKAMQGFPSKEEYTIELLKKIKGKCLIFANTKEQADRICSYSHHSSNKYSSQNLEMFKSGDILRLSAVEQLSEGINIPHLRSAIIMHSYSNSRRTLQKIGRLLRLSVDQLSYVHILCYQDTVDETWVGEALKHFDSQNIKFYYKNV